jgi:hypothetical protein
MPFCNSAGGRHSVLGGQVRSREGSAGATHRRESRSSVFFCVLNTQTEKQGGAQKSTV